MAGLSIRHLTDLSELTNFRCGIALMDDFIHSGFTNCVTSKLCVPYGCYDETNQLVAFFALSFDALDLDLDDKEDLKQGISSDKPILPEGYDQFWGKSRYPAMEITYLAVSKERQHNGIGSSVVEAIADKARTQGIAGCQFLTVNALNVSGYSAVGFYSSIGFSRYGNISQVSDIVPMFYTLFPVKEIL